MEDILIKTLTQLEPLLHERELYGDKISRSFSESAYRVRVVTDKTMLSQVVYNLLMNATKYPEKDTDSYRILIEAHVDDSWFTIKFKDWGIGIKEEDVNRVFQEGFRSPAAVETAGGMGLGLSISGNIMKRLEGSLKLVNNYKPTEFHVKLPLSR